MHKETNIFKVMLALKEDHRGEINLLVRYNDIVEAGHNEQRRSRRPTGRIRQDEQEYSETFLTLNQALEELNNLRGTHELKNEITRIIALYDKLKKEGREQEIRKFFPYHYLFSYDNEGFGLTTTVRIITAIFYHLGIIREPFFKETDILNFRGRFHEEAIGVTAIKCGETSRERTPFDDPREISYLAEHTRISSEEALTIFLVPAEAKQAKEKITEMLHQNTIAYRTIHFPDLTTAQLAEICQEHLTKLGFRLCPEKEAQLATVIDTIRANSNAANLRLVDAVVNAVLTEQLEGYQPADTEPEIVKETVEDRRTTADIIIPVFTRLAGDPTRTNAEDDELAPYRELDNMIGLETVKDRIHEIVSHFVMEKKKIGAGIEGSALCMHMRFAGNPGTGKTTVARIIGRILKEENVLKKGHMVEVGREGLVGGYVGHTALKTKRAIDSARGGILFIDEAYALQSDSNKDFGHEAVSTLLKYMEDYRDDLMVILAGYPREMETMMAMNPGLADRVPHKIDFPDYNPAELYRIFEKQLGSGYTIEETATEQLREIFVNAAKNSGKDFSNGRFVRNLLERLKLKQSQRLYQLNAGDKETLSTILQADLEKLLEDEDMARYLENRPSRGIGFAAAR